MRTSRAVLVLLIAEILSMTDLGAGVTSAVLMIDPEVRELVRVGCARVIVMLQIGESGGDEARRVEAIGHAQDTVVSRLPQSHAVVVRRYTSVPMLALEIDATALLALETMTDVIVAVKSDRPLTTQ